MELGIYFVLFNLLSICLVKCQTYRTDYEYNKKEDAFYKLHIESKPGYIVEKLCEAEGAKLVGTDRQDLVMVHTMLKKYPDLGPMVWIVSDSASHEAEEDEEALIEMVSESSNYDKGCEVMTRNGEIESQLCSKLYPFACKIAAKNITYDNKCDVYSSDFTYYPETGSCYKVSKDVLSWDEAYEDCKAVGAHLAVINSKVESLLLKQFFVTYGMNRLSYHSWYLIIGFRAISPSREFRTIFNQTLEEAGFSEWSYTEPNNYNDSEYCGSIFKSDGKLNDVNCIHKYAFICEKEVRVVST